jgi:hypothetical protein
MQDKTESNYELDFEVLISIKPDTDGIMYYSEFYQKLMAMKHFAWFQDAENSDSFEDDVKLWNLNFEDVPFTIEGKKCKMLPKNFQTSDTGILTPNINDICQYLNSRGIYVKDISQNDFQKYLADYFLFPLVEKDRIEQKEKLFEKIFEEEARLRLRENGVVLDVEGFVDFIQVTRKDIEKLTGDEFKEVVNDYYFLKLHECNGAFTPAPEAEVKQNILSWKSRALFMFYCKKVDANFSYNDTLLYFNCADIGRKKSNYNQLHKAYSIVESLKDRCLPTLREDICIAIQELEKLESYKKSLEIARAEYRHFEVNYPIQEKIKID